ncbi:fumarylacetoacetate hydrolase family protein [Georgenia satyanarayanai]|uniref:fumarylacetoacetate hydrolase family protein n=1 Tax=Georgenia satyanarayanai TaxID=860221 RepID=UPI00203E50CF|nr:fumarylacetoacetate hydrolase family protein [Georgenia satyanarayanai]MCM3661728.1 fumarylacetoacetate hydrolase family protein [Georgenia satyanarayanai]
MRIGRAVLDGTVRHVRFDGDVVRPVGDPYVAFTEGRRPHDDGEAVPAAGLRLLPPTVPTVLVGIAQNRGTSEHPSPVQAWLKSPRTVVAHGEPVRLRRDAGRAVMEAEVAVVIGRDTGSPEGPDLNEGNAHEFVLGVTAVNDISYPDRSTLDPRNFESKGGDGSTPLGPWIDTAASLDTGLLALELDGTRVCATTVEAMPVPVRESLAYVARWLRLGPGDVVMAGAPLSNHEAGPGRVATVLAGGTRLETPLR